MRSNAGDVLALDRLVGARERVCFAQKPIAATKMATADSAIPD